LAAADGTGMTRFARGLVVGKFAPLHRGHELVIRTALEQCREVLLLSYSNPELPGCEPHRRERWLRELFPECRSLVLETTAVPPNDATDSDHRAFVAKICLERLGGGVDAVFTSEDYGDGFARELSEHFCWPVVHVSVDPGRARVPASGTAVRADVHALREWLSPVVYSSFVKRVCLLGGESSGKTTLAAALAEHHHTVWVEEYGRQLWLEKDGSLEYDDLLAIARRQVELEDAALLAARRFVFCDTSPLTTLFYCRELFGHAEAELEQLAGRSYDLHVLCAPDFEFEQDGTRRDAVFRQRQHEFYRHELESHSIPYVSAVGDLQDRVRSLSLELERFK
jgi:HTH-type transcriptional repressor of NAD biosynthesis genes